MRLVVVDPALLVQGALIADSAARRLLVLLYYGHVTNFVRLYERGDDRLTRQFDTLATTGGPSYEQLVDMTEEQSELLGDLLAQAPDDLGLVLSQPLLDRVDDAADRVRERVQGLRPSAVRRVILLACAVYVDVDAESRTFAWEMRWTRRQAELGPDKTLLLDTAALAGGHVIVTDDPVLAPDPEKAVELVDRERGHVVSAYRLAAFVRDEIERSGFRLDDVPPDLLGRALMPPRD